MDLVGISTLTGGVGQMVNGIASNAINAIQGEKNLQFQYDNLEYQKQLQQQIFDREDTSYQRTVKDMKNAGLSPLSMSSTNNSGQAISTQAPQNTYVADATSFNAGMQTISQIGESINNAEKTKAEIDNINAQTKNTDIQNQYQAQLLTASLAKMAEEMQLSHSQRRLLNQQILGLTLDNIYNQTRNNYANDFFDLQNENARASINFTNEQKSYQEFLHNKEKDEYEATNNFWSALGVDPHLNSTAKGLLLDMFSQSVGTIGNRGRGVLFSPSYYNDGKTNIEMIQRLGQVLSDKKYADTILPLVPSMFNAFK